MTGPRLIVDLDVLARNLRTVRERVAPARHMLVVKDDAYGHGLGPVVRRAHAEGVSWFGAFDVDSAETVRAVAGPDVRIFTWLAVGADEIARARGLDLDIGIGDADLLEEVAASPAAGAAQVHLKVDSGLHRNGVRPERWNGFVTRAAQLQRDGRITVEGVWSHIAEASDAEDDDAREIFETAVREAEIAGLHPRLRHLSASAASFARPEFRCDLVRVGAFAYGIRPAGGPSDADLGLAQVARLTAPIVAVDGDRVKIAVGSSDGLPSSLAGRMTVVADGRSHLVERIGLHSIDVRSWDGARRGAEVTVWGSPAPGVTDVAEKIGTIGEEIAVRLARRVPRDYV